MPPVSDIAAKPLSPLQQLSVLAPQRRPLDFLYRLWLKTEYSHIDALRRAVRRETRRIYLKRQTEAFRKEHPMG